jgi:DNA-binding winged helix-turn-helix (wHTH) protein/Tfp pilus assembly protein PilF
VTCSPKVPDRSSGLDGKLLSPPKTYSMSASRSPKIVVRFGVFEADFRAGELLKNGTRVKIQDLPFRALQLLLTNPNEVVSRDRFRQALWPEDVFVDFDRAISSAIKRLRDALGDSADKPIFIETADRRGYRWIAPIHIPESEPKAEPNSASDLNPAKEVLPELPPYSSPISKWTYALPVLALLFIAWTFRYGSHPAKAGVSQPRSAPIASVQLHPANQDAEDLYLQGRYHWAKRTPEDLRKAVDYFTQAIVHDPGYADAYVGLADSYNLLREYTAMPSSEAYPRALAAARKAVELDGQSSQAHASLAFASFWGYWDATIADREFRRAVELDPKNATAHHWYATYLATMGRLSDALVEIDRAQALDPTSNAILADKGSVLARMGRPEDALQLLRQLEKAEPGFVSPHRYLKNIYLDAGDYPHYLAELKKEAVLINDNSAQAVAVAAQKGLDTGGAHAMFENMFHEQQKLYDQGKLSPYVLAETCARLRDKPDTLRYLIAARDRHDEGVTQVGSNHLFDFVQDDPAFQEIVTQLGFRNLRLAQHKPL